MIRGDIWRASGGKDVGKPRPVVILQSNNFDSLGSVTICPFTTDRTVASLMRLAIEPAPGNGLKEPSSLMLDKITTVPKSKLGRKIGHVTNEDMVRLNRGVLVFLGLAD